MTVPKSQLLRRFAIVGAVAAASILGITSAIPNAQALDDGDGIDITVEVVEPSAATSPQSEVVLPLGSPASSASVVITLTGLKGLSAVSVFVNSTPILLTSGLADSRGIFTRTVTLPTGLEAGTHTLSATGTMPNGNTFDSVVFAFSVTEAGLLAELAPEPTVTSNNLTTMTRATASSAAQTIQVSAASADEAIAALGDDAFDLGGVFQLSGLVGTATPAVDPRGGSVKLAMTVQNVTSWAVSPDLRFRLENGLGMQVAQSDDIVIADLRPGETRTVTATLTDIGQWGVFNAQVTFTPPESVRGTVLSPITRDAFLVVPPFFVLSLLGGLSAVFFLVRYLLRRSRTGHTSGVAVGAPV